MKNKNHKHKQGFSLVENIIVLIVLGVIILMTVPNMIRNRDIRNNQIALSKAVVAYQSILRRAIVSSTGVRTTNGLSDIVLSNNCEILSGRSSQLSIVNGAGSCIFRTADGLWWDTTYPEHTIISLDRAGLTMEDASDTENIRTFYVPFSVNPTTKGVQILSPVSPATLTQINAAQKTRNFISGN